MIGDLLMYPVLKRVLCIPTNLSFNPRSTHGLRLARWDTADLLRLLLGGCGIVRCGGCDRLTILSYLYLNSYGRGF